MEKDRWRSDYQLTIDLQLEAMESAYRNGQINEMERIAQTILANARTVLEKIKVYELRSWAYNGQSRYIESIENMNWALGCLGTPLPKPSKLNAAIAIFRTGLMLRGKRAEDLLNLPQMTDPEKLAATRILSGAGTAARAVPDLIPLIGCKITQLSFRFGNSPWSPIGYAVYGMVLCAFVENIDRGYSFGKLALDMVEKNHSPHLKARVHVVFDMFVRHWKAHLLETLPSLSQAHKCALEDGDIEYAAIALLLRSIYLFFGGRPLADVERQMAEAQAFMEKHGQSAVLGSLKLYRQAVSNLTTEAENPGRLTGRFFDEAETARRLFGINDIYIHFGLYLTKLMLCCLFRNFDGAVKSSEQAEKYMNGCKGRSTYLLFHFYDSLARLARPDKQTLKRVDRNQKKLNKWAKYAPVNHMHRYLLVEAERNRVAGDPVTATASYQKAIEHAYNNRYHQETALCHERFADFLHENNLRDEAQMHMSTAYSLYRSWGAAAKLKEMEKRHSYLTEN